MKHQLRSITVTIKTGVSEVMVIRVNCFYRIDKDSDGYLNEGELDSWILDKINEHMNEAMEENTAIFKHLDPDGDGW